MKIEYPNILVGIECDHVQGTATLTLAAAGKTNKKQLAESVYADTVVPLLSHIELPIHYIYTGNANHKVIRPEFKRMIGRELMLSADIGEVSSEENKA